jgi:hypothetical protein
MFINQVEERRMERRFKKHQANVVYPIRRILFLVYLYRLVTLVIIIFTSSYFIGVLWYIFVTELQSLPGQDNFYFYFGIDQIEKPREQLLMVWYFAITTLSTIGYGDMYPVSTPERIAASFILLIGVAVFSFIMGNLIEMLTQYRNLEKQTEGKNLSKWLGLLTRFHNGKPLKKNLIADIEDFFEFYWQHNKLSALESEADQRFMKQLPESVQGRIYTDFLFKDFLYTFKTYLKVKLHD